MANLGTVHPSRASRADWGQPASIVEAADSWLRVIKDSSPFAGNGSFNDGARVAHRAPDGVTTYVVCPTAINAVASTNTSTITTRLEGRASQQVATPVIHPDFEGIMDRMAVQNAKRWRLAVMRWYKVDSEDDCAERFLPSVAELMGESDLVTPFVKLWLYFFAATQLPALGRGPLLTVPLGLPGTTIEDSKTSHAAYDADIVLEDGVIVDPRPSMERCRMWRAMVMPFPCYLMSNAAGNRTVAALKVAIDGGNFTYCGRGMVAGFADWAAYPSALRWKTMISTMAMELNAQDDCLAAFHLAAVLATSVVDNVTYRGVDPVPAGGAAVNVTRITAAAHLRGAPLPDINMSRMRLLPLLSLGRDDHPLHRMTTLSPAALMRVAILWSCSLAYALKHAMYAFGIKAKSLTHAGARFREYAHTYLFRGREAAICVPPAPIVMCASHIMRCCFGTLIPHVVAPFLCPGADDSGSDGLTSISCIYGNEPPGWVTTPQVLHRMYDVPSTCGFYVLGTNPEPGRPSTGGNPVHIWNADQPFAVVPGRRDEHMFWSGADVLARNLHSALAYANSTHSAGAANASNLAACLRSSQSWRNGQNGRKQMNSFWDSQIGAFRREGCVPIFSIGNAYRWAYSVDPTHPMTDLQCEPGGLPSRWLVMQGTPNVITGHPPPIDRLDELVQRADENPVLPMPVGDAIANLNIAAAAPVVAGNPGVPIVAAAGGVAHARELKGFGADLLRMPEPVASAVLSACKNAESIERAGARYVNRPARICAEGDWPTPPYVNPAEAGWMRANPRGGLAELNRVEQAQLAGYTSRYNLARWRVAIAPALCDPTDYKQLGAIVYTPDVRPRSLERPWIALSTHQLRNREMQVGRTAFCAKMDGTFEATDGQEENLLRFKLYDALICAQRVMKKRGQRRKEITSGLDQLFRGLGPTNEVQVVMYIIFICLVSGADQVITWAKKKGVLACERFTQVKIWKAVTTHVTRTRHAPDGSAVGIQEMLKWCYLQQYAGRSGMRSDWEAERAARATPHYAKVARTSDNRLMSSEQYWRDFEDVLFKAFRKMFESDVYVGTTLHEFWEERATWVTSGSATRTPYDAVLPDEVAARLDKRSLFEILDNDWLDKVANGPARMLATEAEKFENGTNRALYAALPEHYAMMTYVLKPLEPLLAKSGFTDLGADGPAEAEAQANRFDRLREAYSHGADALMYDYANMNGQESMWEQQCVMRQALKALSYGRLRGHGRESYMQASQWVIDSFDDARLAASNLRIVHGLFSGLRGTSWINTMVNYAWFQVARRGVIRGGMRDPLVDSQHHGDDVWAITRNRASSIALKRELDAMGIEGQDSKCMVGPDAGEFLRLLYDAPTARVVGYPNRAIAAFVSPSYQTDHWPDSLSKATAMWGVAATLKRRGCDAPAVDLVVSECITRTCRYTRTDGTKMSVDADVARAVGDGWVAGPEYTINRGLIKGLPTNATNALCHRVMARAPKRYHRDILAARADTAADSWAIAAGARSVKFIPTHEYEMWQNNIIKNGLKQPPSDPPWGWEYPGYDIAVRAVDDINKKRRTAEKTLGAVAALEAAKTSASTFGNARIFGRLASANGGLYGLTNAWDLRQGGPGSALCHALTKCYEIGGHARELLIRGVDIDGIFRGYLHILSKLAPEWSAVIRGTILAALSRLCLLKHEPALFGYTIAQAVKIGLSGLRGYTAAY